MYAMVLKFIMLHSKGSLDDCNIVDVALALEHCLCVWVCMCVCDTVNT